MSDAPSLSIIPKLQFKGTKIVVYDPKAETECDAWEGDPYMAAVDADAVVLTEWNAFRGLELVWLKNKMAGAVFVDLLNIYGFEEMTDTSLQYFPIGKPQKQLESEELLKLV